jgi:hypothetical protein
VGRTLYQTNRYGGLTGAAMPGRFTSSRHIRRAVTGR